MSQSLGWQIGSAAYQICAVITARQAVNEYRVKPLGRLRIAEEAVAAFNQAADFEQAAAAARAYVQGQELFKRARKVFFKNTANYQLSLPRLDLPETPDFSDHRIRWAAQDASGDLFRFYQDAHYENERRQQLIDCMPLAALRGIAESCGLQWCLRERELFEGVTFPVDTAPLAHDPAAWVAKFAIVLQRPSVRDDQYSRYHPYYGKGPEEREALHLEAWSALCGELDRRLQLGQEAEVLNLVQHCLPFTRFGFGGGFAGDSLHPFTDFLARHADLFPLDERIPIFAAVLGRNFHAYCHLGKIDFPETLRDLRGFLDETAAPVGGRGIYERTSRDSEHSQHAVNELPNIALARIVSRLQDQQCAGTPATRGQVAELLPLLPAVCPEREEIYRQARSAIHTVFFSAWELSRNPHDSLVPGISPRAAVAAYHYFVDNRMFPDVAVRAAWGEQLCNAIAGEQNAALRFELYRAALDNGSASTSRIQDVNVRSKLVAGLAQTVRELSGRDDGSDKFRSGVLQLAARSRRWCSSAVRREFCAQLGQALLAQRTLACALRDEARLGADELVAANLPAKGCEALLDAVSQDDKKRQALLIWLTSAGGEQETEVFRLQIHEWEAEAKGRWAASWSSGRNLLERALLNNDRDDERAACQSLSETQRVALERTLLHDLYAAFADQDQRIQALFLKHVLIPPRQDYERGEAAVWDACGLVLDRLFPLTGHSEESSERRHALFAREFIRTFLEVSHESERGLILGALVAAARANESSGGGVSVGRSLRTLFAQLGPAYVKLGQAMHSYPGTPEEIRAELADLKGNVNKPLVWELWEMIDEVIPQEARAEIGFLEEVAGAASFHIVVFFRTPDGERRALALLRPYALPQGLKGFETLAQVAGRVDCLREYRDDALRIIGHARDLTYTETDTKIGAVQAALQCQQYEGVRIRRFKNEILFVPSPWLRHGEGWRYMQAAPGAPFDALPEETQEQRTFKDEVAQAILVVELTLMLRGEEFDFNRHERQYHVHERVIYPVDAGGMSLTCPSPEENSELGHTIGRLAARLQAGSASPQEAMEEVLQIPVQSGYAQRVRDGLLYLNFAFSRLRGRQLQDVFLAGRFASLGRAISRAVLGRGKERVALNNPLLAAEQVHGRLNFVAEIAAENSTNADPKLSWLSRRPNGSWRRSLSF